MNTDRTFGAPLITVVAPPLRWVVTSILFFHFPSTWSSYSTLSMFQTSILFYSTLLSIFCFFFLLINFSIFDFFVGFFLISTVNLEALEFFWGDWALKKSFFFNVQMCVPMHGILILVDLMSIVVNLQIDFATLLYKCNEFSVFDFLCLCLMSFWLIGKP